MCHITSNKNGCTIRTVCDPYPKITLCCANRDWKPIFDIQFRLKTASHFPSCLNKMQQLIALQSLHGVLRIERERVKKKTCTKTRDDTHRTFKQVYAFHAMQMVKLFDADLFYVFNSNLFYANRKKRKSFVPDYLSYTFFPFIHSTMQLISEVLVHVPCWSFIYFKRHHSENISAHTKWTCRIQNYGSFRRTKDLIQTGFKLSKTSIWTPSFKWYFLKWECF